MFTSASPQILKESAKDLEEICEDLQEISQLLNDKEDACDCCGLNVKQNFQQYVWKRAILHSSRKLLTVAKEMDKSHN